MSVRENFGEIRNKAVMVVEKTSQVYASKTGS